MQPVANPALDAFLDSIGAELAFAQVLIRRQGAGFELRHVEDRKRSPGELRLLKFDEVRPLVQFTATGAFRPLKSAPNLQTGWRLLLANSSGLEAALQQIYPGAVADWFAAREPEPPVTHYREFVARQTGMYRITALLDDEPAARAARATCHPAHCLKQRLWTVPGLPPDARSEKSLISCLEPCAILLEFARKAMRMEQQEKIKIELAPDEAATMVAAIRCALLHPAPAAREADFSAPDNPRRLRHVLEKLEPLLPAVSPEPAE